MGLDPADYGLLKSIHNELEQMNKLKKMELEQQIFLIELIEEILPIPDNRKRQLPQKNIRSNI